MSRVIALADINNAFCEFTRLFEPKLRGIPLVIAGSNDSMIVARSYEAKALSIKMAEPYFKVQHLEKRGLVRRSANFPLFTNISQRVTTTLDEFSLSVMPYSIDESFFLLNEEEPGGLESYGRLIKNTVLKRTGQPICVGISETRTLSKAANYSAKKYPATGGVVNIYGNPNKRKRMLTVMPVGEVWGCGKATTQKLNDLGVMTALDLAELDPEEAQSKFNINLRRTIQELNGMEVVEWEPDLVINKQIIATRSLGTKTSDRAALISSIAAHVSRATLKLRKQKAAANMISLFIQTSLFAKNEPSYSKEISTKLSYATSDSRVLLKTATEMFDEIYRPGFKYSRTGITLSNIVPESEIQNDLFSDNEADDKNKSLMEALDSLNNRFGQGTLKLGAESMSDKWKPQSNWKSPDYTGSWDELCIVKC